MFWGDREITPARIDNVKFQEGSVISQYNYITNKSFEIDNNKDGLPDMYAVSGGMGTSDVH